MKLFSKKQILELAKKYSYKTKDEPVEREIKKWLKNHRYLDKDRFIRLCLWKSARQRKNYEKNDDLTIREITRFSFLTKSERARIESLQILDGVSYPVASTILHFAFPDKYPIMDFRVIWSLGWRQPKYYNFGFWQKYVNELRKLAKKYKVSLRKLDKALWYYSKENQKNDQNLGRS